MPPETLLSSFSWRIPSFLVTFQLVPGGRSFTDQHLNLLVAYILFGLGAVKKTASVDVYVLGVESVASWVLRLL